MSDQNTELVIHSGSGLTTQEAEFIPFQHHEEWLGTPLDEKQRIKEMLGAMQSIKADERGVVQACTALAQLNCNRKGWSKHNLKTLYYGWRETEDWRLLRRNYRHESALPVEFTRYLCTMVLREHRSRKQAIERVRASWRAGEIIPGYGTWRQWFAASWPDRDVPAHFGGDYPDGWSTTNLRNQMPSRAQHTLATRGLAAAQRHLPHLIRDTSALRPLEMVVFDDFKTDIRVAAYNPVLRKWEIVPCAGLVAMDVATRLILSYGLVPRLTLPKRASRDDHRPLTPAEIEADEKMRKISVSRADLQRVLKEMFQRYGVPADYAMTLLVENAAAAITEGLESALEIYFHGQVRVCRTDMLEQRTPGNGFIERGGKPWEKGWIESAFNLMHNLAGNLPGQTGSLEMENAPGDLAARIAYSLAVLDGMSPEQAEAAKLPVLKVEDAMLGYGKIFELMDQRGEHAPHRMLGFDKLKVCRSGPGLPWQPLEQLTLTAGDDCSAIEVVERPQSPRERWAALKQQVKPFAKVPDFVIALLAFTPTKKIAFRNHRVTFVHGGEGFTFLDLEGKLKALSEGTKVIGYFDEASPSHLYLTNLAGTPLAVLPRQPSKTDITDPAAISAAQAVMARFFQGQVAGPVEELLADDRAAALADADHNDAERARLGLDPISSSVRPSASRAHKMPGDNADTGGKPAPRRLSSTLARDEFDPGKDRFAAAAQTAGSIAAATLNEQGRIERAAEVRRQSAALSAEDLQDFGSAPAEPLQSSAPTAGEQSMTDYI